LNSNKNQAPKNDFKKSFDALQRIPTSYEITNEQVTSIQDTQNCDSIYKSILESQEYYHMTESNIAYRARIQDSNSSKQINWGDKCQR
jgi:hypothetical protein